jgi:hypothetical protein
MMEWWESLTGINRAFFSAAAFFSVFFLWQLLAALLGLGDEDGGGAHDGADGMASDVDGHGDAFEDGAHVDSSETVMAFKLLSIRAIITFCTMFTWGTALYLYRGDSVARAMGVASIWGILGMVCVALVLSLLPKLAQTGTARIASALGAHGSVYLDIPADGVGEVRVSVSDVISFVKARSFEGKALKAGTAVVVTRVLDATTVEVDEASVT